MNVRRTLVLLTAEVAVVGAVAVFAIEQVGSRGDGSLTVQPGPATRAVPGMVAVGTPAPATTGHATNARPTVAPAIGPGFGAGFWAALNRNIGETGTGEARLLTELGEAVRREAVSLLPGAPRP